MEAAALAKNESRFLPLPSIKKRRIHQDSEPDTMNSQNRQSSSSLLSLPFDMIQAVLCFIPDIPSLRAVISTCTTLHRAFHNVERLVTERVLSNQMGSELLREAYMVLESSRLKSCWSKKAVKDFVERQKVIITTDIRRPWTLTGGIYVDKIYQHVQYFAADFASSAVSEVFQLTINAPPPPSASEMHRMKRTFFLFELYCNLFRNYKTPNETRFSPEGQRELFLKQFPPWEVEQLVCVRDYLLRYIADGMPIFLYPLLPIIGLYPLSTFYLHRKYNSFQRRGKP